MARFDFSKFEVKSDRTKRITLYDIALDDEATKTPSLICRPGTQANRAYFAAVLKRGQKNARRLRAGKMTPQMLIESRDEDRELYPLHVIVGWEDVIDADGQAVPYTAKDCGDFLASLPDWVFDNLRNELADPVTFLEDGDPTPEEVDEKAKN